MKKILIIIGFLIFQSSFAQELTIDFELSPSADVNGPKFNDGDATKFYEFINARFDFDKVKKSGKMTIGFTVNEIGELKNIKIIEFPEPNAAIEMIRVLNLSPKWEPANRNGKPFSTDLKLPFNFRFKLVDQIVEERNQKSEPVMINDILQEDGLDLNEKNQSDIPAKVFNGGLNKFYEFIIKNYNTPFTLNNSGKVVVSFVIDVDGSLTDIKVLKHLGHGTGEEAIRVLKLSPKWTPGIKNGIPVKCFYTLPINVSALND